MTTTTGTPTNYETCLEACETLAAKIDASDDVWLNQPTTGDGWSVTIGPRAAAELTALLHG